MQEVNCFYHKKCKKLTEILWKSAKNRRIKKKLINNRDTFINPRVYNEETYFSEKMQKNRRKKKYLEKYITHRKAKNYVFEESIMLVN
jgi:hypothetical protein